MWDDNKLDSINVELYNINFLEHAMDYLDLFWVVIILQI